MLEGPVKALKGTLAGPGKVPQTVARSHICHFRGLVGASRASGAAADHRT